MLRKNVASQVVTFSAVNATTGAALTGATVTTKVTLDGTQGASAGTLTELGTGQYKYVPTQGETNGSSVGFGFTATNMVPVNLHCFTIGQDPALATLDTNVTKLLGTAWLTPGTAGTPDVNVKLWNALATVALPLIPTTAGRTLDVTATGEAGIDWANVGAPTTTLNLSGTTIATTQKVDIETIKTNAVVNAGTITFPTTATLASTTNITAGTVTTATTATNVTTVNGLAANVITAASINAAALNGKGDWNIGKTGYALSAAGVQAIWDALTSALTTVGSIGKLLVDNVNATITSRASQTSVDTVDDFLDTEIAAILAAVDTEIASILSLLDDARTEPGQGNPPVNPDMATKVDYLYKWTRNKKDNDGTTTKLYADDGSTVDQKRVTSEAAGTVTEGEIATGP